MVPLRSTQNFAPLHSAKTSFSRETLSEIAPGRWATDYVKKTGLGRSGSLRSVRIAGPVMGNFC